MLNKFIGLYQAQSLIDPKREAIKAALAAIYHDRENWAFGYRFDSASLLKMFYNPFVTKRHQANLNAIIEALDALPGSDLSIYNLLLGYLPSFNEGETKNLLNHIINELYLSCYNSEDNRPPQDLTSIRISDILDKKNIPSTIFQNVGLTIESHISEHVAWLFDNIYSKKYPRVEPIDGIARYLHGIQHVTRAAMYSKVWINLYRKYGDEDALKLTNEDAKLIELALLFHDAAREDEKEDLWDNESAALLFKYLVDVLNVPLAKAILIAEATANKDVYPDRYYALKIENNEIIWEKQASRPKKNIYQKIIHDSDCLDIIRARAAFDGNYLDFDKQFTEHNEAALNDLAHFKNEALSLICEQGDEYEHTNSELKKKFENRNAYQNINDSVTPEKHPLIYALRNASIAHEELAHIIPARLGFVPEKGLCADNLNALMDEGKLFARAIYTPSKLTTKHPDETQASLELRKTHRRKGTATRSKKANRDEKSGNPVRSGSLLGYGTHIFANAGFGIFQLDIDTIQTIAVVDDVTGYGKKKEALLKRNLLSREEKISQLEVLLQKMKKGGMVYADQNYDATHVELMCDIFEYDFILFSKQHNIANAYTHTHLKGNPFHPHAPLLEAVYLQSLHAAEYGRQLPIFEYNANNHKITFQRQLTSQELINYWVEMCGDFLGKDNDSLDMSNCNLSLEEIKIKAMYGSHANLNEYQPADMQYDNDTRAALNKALQALRQEVINKKYERLYQAIRAKQVNILEQSVTLALLAFSNHPEDIENYIKEKIIEECKKEYKGESFDPASAALEYISDQSVNDGSRTFSENEHLRLYYLAKQFHDPSAASMRQAVAEHVITSSDKYKSSSFFEYNYHYRDLINLMVIAKAYDLSDKFESKLDDLSLHFMAAAKNNMGNDFITDASKELFLVEEVCKIVNLRGKLNTINAKTKEIAESVIKFQIKLIRQGGVPYGLIYKIFDLYYDCALNEPSIINNFRAIVMRTISSRENYRTDLDYDRVVELISRGRFLKDPVIFRQAIENINYIQRPIDNYFSIILDSLNKYQTSMKDQQFSKWQKTIISEIMNQEVKSYFSQLNAEAKRCSFPLSLTLSYLQESMIFLSKQDELYKPYVNILFDVYCSNIISETSTFNSAEICKINDFLALLEGPGIQELRDEFKKKIPTDAHVSDSPRL